MRWLHDGDASTWAARRIVVIKPSALGDVVQSLPVVSQLKDAYPDAIIHWVINRELTGLVAGQPGVDEVIPFNRKGSLRDWATLLGRLRRGRYDLALDLQGLMRTGLMTWATGARRRVGLETAREGSAYTLTHTIAGTGRDVPAHARYLRVGAAVGSSRGYAPFHVAPEHDAWVREQLRMLPRPWIAVQPGSRWATKSWPADQFGVVAARAARKTGGSVIIVGSPNETLLAEACESAARGEFPSVACRSFVGKSNLPQLGGLLKAADLLLCNDSGPMHLAASIGTPVFGLFTCTSPIRSGPSGVQHELVSTRLECGAGYHKTCPLSGTAHLACFRDLDVGHVWNRLELHLQRLGLTGDGRAEAA